METKELLQAMVDVHNRLAEIGVRGDDAIRMAEVLQRCRAIVFQLQQPTEPTVCE